MLQRMRRLSLRKLFVGPSTTSFFHTLFFILLTTLDVRDLWFKMQYLGPNTTYTFPSNTIHRLDANNSITYSDLIVLNTTRELEDNSSYPFKHASGWSSFLSSCESMSQFHLAGAKKHDGLLYSRLLARNCRITPELEHKYAVTIPNLVVTADVRLDSLAFIACNMLYPHRRLPICRETMVIRFLSRYQKDNFNHRAIIPVEELSEAEIELRVFLDAISKSTLLDNTVCVQGFRVDHNSSSITSFRPQLFGCGSPILNESVFIGYHAKSFAKLHEGLSSLTYKELSFYDLSFVVRQQASVEYSVDNTGKNMELTQATNYTLACSGGYYELLVFVDCILFIYHTLSGLELIKKLPMAVRQQAKLTNEERLFDIGNRVPVNSSKNYIQRPPSVSLTLAATSLYRHPTIILLSLVSQMLTWLIVIPGSFIWSKSTSMEVIVHLILTIFRLWVLLLIVIQIVWDTMSMWISEEKAYNIIKATCISSSELIIIWATTLLVFRSHFDTIKKNVFQHWRDYYLQDSNVFENRYLVSNRFLLSEWNLTLDTSDIGFYHIYHHLILFIFKSAVLSVIYMLIKYYFNSRKMAMIESQIPSRELRWQAYMRVPMEIVVKIPMRSRSIVRSHLELIHLNSISPSGLLSPFIYLPYGVEMDQNFRIFTRWPFNDIVKGDELSILYNWEESETEEKQQMGENEEGMHHKVEPILEQQIEDSLYMTLPIPEILHNKFPSYTFPQLTEM